jgi:acyl-CoA thioesterase FadM
MSAIEIDWLESGRPTLKGAQAGGLGVSLSHDDRLCIGVAGSGPQGCDIAPVTTRSREEWRALLGEAREALLEPLLAAGDPLDRAGTRIWAAAEALGKANGVRTVAPTLGPRDGDSVLFGDGELSVLTFPLKLTRGPERIIAVVVTPAEAPSAEAVPAARAPDGLEQLYGFDFGAHDIFAQAPGPGGRPALTLRFPVTFREVANLSRTLYFSHYSAWLGKLRELAIQPVYEQLSREFATGRWGMVTNRSETRILGELRADDVVEGTTWIERLSGPHGSTQDLHFDWSKVLPGGSRERVAWSTMRATWVEILDHGIVEARPLPAYFQSFVEPLTVPLAPASAPLPAELGELGLGPLVHETPKGPVNPALLHERVFATTLEDANLVGNLYFANYYVWQGRVRDEYFQRVAPGLYRGTGERGELRCAYSKVEHLREAMPFERIAVAMSLDALHEHGVRLAFVYSRVLPDGERQKLAFGEHVAAWLEPAADGAWRPAALPEVFRTALLTRSG